VVENLEKSGGDLGVPVVERDRAIVVSPGGLEESVKTGVADPRRNLIRAHADAVSVA
jgi:hypothetical protein